MREVAPGDLVFSFCDTRIRAFGIARSHAYEAPKPEEFAQAGRNWSAIGWRVDVEFHELPTANRPADWMALLGPLLPERYAPLLPDGRGIQSVYLTELSAPFAFQLAEVVGSGVDAIARGIAEATPTDSPRGKVRDEEREPVAPVKELVLWEEHLRDEIMRDRSIGKTEKEQLIVARRGQGQFRRRVERLERMCRVTHVDRSEHLRASHCKPWRDCTNEERLDGENGLLLTPSIDHLFDRGFISLRDDGRLLVSPVAHQPSLLRMGVVGEIATGGLTEGQRRYLEYHRDAVFLSSNVRRPA